MNIQHYETLCNKVDSFMAHFEKVPIPKQSIAWDHFYHNYFSSMSNTILNCIIDLNYAKAKEHFKTPKQIFTTTLCYDQNNQLVRHIGLDAHSAIQQTHLLEYIQSQLNNFRATSQQDSYTLFNCTCYTNPNKTESFLITGFINQNSKNEHITLHLVSVQTNLQQHLNSKNSVINSYKDPKNLKELKNQIALEHGSCIDSLCEKWEATPGQLSDYFKTHFGFDIPTVQQKERALKGLELILFSDMDLQKIATELCFTNWEELNQYLTQNMQINLPLIRYNTLPTC
ncbi:hypothetical protein ACYSNM_04420 [Myroides sp. LJL116]